MAMARTKMEKFNSLVTSWNFDVIKVAPDTIQLSNVSNYVSDAVGMSVFHLALQQVLGISLFLRAKPKPTSFRNDRNGMLVYDVADLTGIVDAADSIISSLYFAMINYINILRNRPEPISTRVISEAIQPMLKIPLVELNANETEEYLSKLTFTIQENTRMLSHVEPRLFVAPIFKPAASPASPSSPALEEKMQRDRSPAMYGRGLGGVNGPLFLVPAEDARDKVVAGVTASSSPSTDSSGSMSPMNICRTPSL